MTRRNSGNLEPVEEPTPEKGESTEKQETTEKTVKLKRRSETEGEEPQAKKGSITSGSEVVKPVELKPATSISTAVPSGKDKGAQEAQTLTAVSEKRPHTPRSGIVLKTAEEVQQQDAGEKAPHRQSSDDADDAELADQLQKASSVAGTSRKGHEGSDGPRSVDVVCDDGGSRTLDTSSKVTVSAVEDDPYAPTQVSVISPVLPFPAFFVFPAFSAQNARFFSEVCVLSTQTPKTQGKHTKNTRNPCFLLFYTNPGNPKKTREKPQGKRKKHKEKKVKKTQGKKGHQLS